MGHGVAHRAKLRILCHHHHHGSYYQLRTSKRCTRHPNGSAPTPAMTQPTPPLFPPLMCLFLFIFREEVKLGAVNSINWARVLAQMTYYFWAHFRVRYHTDIIHI